MKLQTNKQTSVIKSSIHDRGFLSIVDRIKQAIWQAWEKTAKNNDWPVDLIKSDDIKIEHPAEEKFGDYSTNVAMAVFHKLQAKSNKLEANPLELAELISNNLTNYLPTNLINSVQIAPPGFINLTINNDYLIGQLYEAIKQGDSYGKTDFLAGQKIMVEYTDPNLFKEFHIGHLTTNLIGESLALIFEANGAEVKRADYQGDVGMHIAKAVWGMVTKLNLKNKKLKIYQEELAKIEKKDIKTRTHWLGECYALGAKVYEEDKQKAEEIKDINYYVYLAGQEYLQQKEGWQPQVNYRQYVQYNKDKYELVKKLYLKGREWSLAYFETIYRRLGTKFDYYFFESLVGEYGHKTVTENLKKGIFQQSQGAIVYLGEKEGLHTRVFINSFGLPTYEAKDLGLAQIKYRRFPYSRSFNIVGSEIGAYFKVVMAALKMIDPILAAKTIPLIHGMVRRPEGKMSSRTGNVFTVDSLIEEVKTLAKKVIQKAITTKITENEIEDITELIALGAIKYMWLKSGISKDIVFDVEKSVSLQGNSGPYLQYTFARTQSVLVKSKTDKFEIRNSKFEINREELAILRWIYRYLEVVRQAAEEYAPNVVCGYLYELAQRFNTFYNKHRIIQLEKKLKIKNKNANLKFKNSTFNENLKLACPPTGGKIENCQIDNLQLDNSQFRIVLTAATAQILKNGLYLLGIKAPKKM